MEIIRPTQDEKYDNYIKRILESRENKKDTDNYQEEHHIIPRCKGGIGIPHNTVWLYAQEHYYAHKLLAKENPHDKQLQYAFFMMSNGSGEKRKQNIKLTPEEYQEQREYLSKALSGENNPRYGKKASEETRRKMSEHSRRLSGENHPLYGTHHTDEEKQYMSELMSKKQKGENNSFFGKTHSEASKKKMSEAHKGHICTKETAQKISQSKMGHEVSQETRQKISNNKKGCYTGGDNGHSFKVVCDETGQLFNSCIEASTWAHAGRTGIGSYLKGVYKSAGRHPDTGEKLHWHLPTEEELKEINKSVETAGNIQ